MSGDFTLLQQLSESINDKGLFKAVFILGIPGAGKSTVIRQITDGAIHPRVVNTDKQVEFLHRQGKIDASDPKHWDQVGDKVQKLVVSQLALYVNAMVPLYIDTTSASSQAVLRRKGLLESFGYDVMAVWVDVDVETARERVRARNNQRHVDDDHVVKSHEHASKTRDFVLSRFEHSIIVNNDANGNTVDLSVFKKIRDFYLSPLANPIGAEYVQTVKDRNEKYLSDSLMSINRLQGMADAWYAIH